MRMASKKKPHRNERFKQLLLERFKNNQKVMADELDIAPSLISRYAKDKGLGEDMRIYIEKKLKLPEGWFDESNSEITIKDDTSLLKMLGASKDGLSVTMVEKIQAFLEGTSEQQDKALAVIKEEQTGRSKESGNGNEGK